MDTVFIILTLSVTCVIITKTFMNDNTHDFELLIGKFKFSIKKHDKE